MDARFRCLAFLASLLFLLQPACFGATQRPVAATPPEFVPVGGQTKCKVAAGKLNPLIVEWAAADRASLEVLAQRGTVAVRFTGCELEVLPRCRAPGAYRYVPTNRKTERVVIQDEDDLYANLPIGAVKLEGKLQRAGQLDVNMNVVGQWDVDQDTIPHSSLEGDCSKATHVVTGLTVGAFEFTAGGSAQASGQATVVGTGAGASTSQRREMLSSDGEVAACENATGQDTEPPMGCGALLRISLAELKGPEPVVAPAALACPEGTHPVNGQCLPLGGLVGTSIASATRMYVRVTCGSLPGSLLGESEGLQVWIDGELTPAVEEIRAFNAMAPGAPGILQAVAYEVSPGEHRVRIAASECEPVENAIKVNPGTIRDVGGRLRPTPWHRKPPAGAAGVGLGLNYTLAKYAHITLESEALEEFQATPDTYSGFGIEIPFSVGYTWSSLGFSWMKADLPFEVPGCKDPAECLPAGTAVDATSSAYRVPLLVGGRLPFEYGAGMLGAGIELGIHTASIPEEAENNMTSYSSGNFGLHAPVWAGAELRPFCSLSLSARAAHGFSLHSDVGSYNAVTFSAAFWATEGCSQESFGIQ